MIRKLMAGSMSLLLGSASLLASPAAANDHYTVSDVTIESGDGTILTARLYRPTGHAATPVVVRITPYGTTRAADDVERPDVPGVTWPASFADELTEAGYSYLQVNLRGFHTSEGCGDLGGDGEQMDAVAAIEWAASQPWSTGKVGTIGHSYDAFAQVMALDEGAEGHAAAVITGPLTSAYKMFFMNGVHYNGQWDVMAEYFAAQDLAGPSVPRGGAAECYAANEIETRNPDPTSPYWTERDLAAGARSSTVPTFWGIGFNDVNTKPDNFLDVYSGLSGPKRAWVGQWLHDGPSDSGRTEGGVAAFELEVLRFFEQHLRGSGAAGVDPAVEVEQGPDGVWRSETQWPPADATAFELPVKTGTYRDVVTDDAGLPHHWLNVSGGEEEDASGTGTWTFSQELPYDVHLSGTPRVELFVDSPNSGVHLNVRLFDVAPDGTASIVTRGAALVGGGPSSTTPLSDEPVSFDLYPQDYVIAEGHRIGLLISGADNEVFDPGTTGAEVTVRGAFEVPFLQFLRTPDLEHVPGTPLVRRVAVTETVVGERAVEMPLPPEMTTP